MLAELFQYQPLLRKEDVVLDECSAALGHGFKSVDVGRYVRGRGAVHESLEDVGAVAGDVLDKAIGATAGLDEDAVWLRLPKSFALEGEPCLENVLLGHWHVIAVQYQICHEV